MDALSFARGQGDDAGDHPDRSAGDMRPEESVGPQMHPGRIAGPGLKVFRQGERGRQREDGGDESDVSEPGCHGPLLVDGRGARHDRRRRAHDRL